jgi:hypothetical protein
MLLPVTLGLGLGVLLAMAQSPAAAVPEIRAATLADIPRMVAKAREQASQSTEEYTQRFTTLLKQAGTIALVSEAEGEAKGFLIAALYTRPTSRLFAAPESFYALEWSWVVEDPERVIQQGLVQELFRQAAARGVKEVVVAAQR